jgi:hypothetical protein
MRDAFVNNGQGQVNVTGEVSGSVTVNYNQHGTSEPRRPEVRDVTKFWQQRVFEYDSWSKYTFKGGRLPGFEAWFIANYGYNPPANWSEIIKGK